MNVDNDDIVQYHYGIKCGVGKIITPGVRYFETNKSTLKIYCVALVVSSLFSRFISY